jgi:L,D-peptidoglycan transpeptidase YkuD (ErfK/YbiS/YcfS/YnhG family)
MQSAPNFSKDIIVSPAKTGGHKGVLRFLTHRTRCALGAGGVTHAKKEGDKKTPLGRFALRRIWYRPDRVSIDHAALPICEIGQKSGWCDASTHPLYNQAIERPFTASHEKLWRHDRLYNVFIELGVNDAPPAPHQGSAIFLHLEKNNFQPTLGCVAVSFESMKFILTHAQADTHINIMETG